MRRFIIKKAADLYRPCFGRGDAANIVIGVNVTTIMMICRPERRPRQGEKNQRQAHSSLPGCDQPAGNRSKEKQEACDEWHGRVTVEYNTGCEG